MSGVGPRAWSQEGSFEWLRPSSAQFLGVGPSCEIASDQENFICRPARCPRSEAMPFDPSGNDLSNIGLLPSFWPKLCAKPSDAHKRGRFSRANRTFFALGPWLDSGVTFWRLPLYAPISHQDEGLYCIAIMPLRGVECAREVK